VVAVSLDQRDCSWTGSEVARGCQSDSNIVIVIVIVIGIVIGTGNTITSASSS
jgi:hypothetical protein